MAAAPPPSSSEQIPTSPLPPPPLQDPAQLQPQHHQQQQSQSQPQPTVSPMTIDTPMAPVSEKNPAAVPDLDVENNTDKFDNYYADFTRYVQAKYFSGKNLYGGNVFEKETVIDGESIKASRYPPTQPFMDPVKSFEDQKSSTSSIETPASVPNKKYQGRKNYS